MLLKLLGFLSILCYVNSQLISLEKDDLSLTIDENLNLVLDKDGEEKLSGTLGFINLDGAKECDGVSDCLQFGNIRLHVTSNIENGFEILWTSTDTSVNFRDCYWLKSGEMNWFGGPERYDQYWPIEKLTLTDFANVPQEDQWGAVVEPYWLNSKGAYIFVDERTPLFIDQNSYYEDAVCFVAKIESPYRSNRPRVLLSYTIVATENAREGHIHAINHFLGKPTGHPASWIVENPIWSSWARYKTEINDDILLEFANEIIDNGYTGQFEIDDFWETCYGSLVFRDPEFTEITNTVQTVKDMGFTVALWTHPFVNLDCIEYAEIARNNDFVVKNEDGSAFTQWWQSLYGMAHLIDFTNDEARNWFTSRLQRLRDVHGIDTFKFDAGETSWAPQAPVIYGDIELSPNKMTADYVRACATFGDHIEVRTGWRTQDLPVFVRMIDKDSRWGLNNGLKSLVTTLLQMNINGYPMVLPDMVGGNGYINESPTAEMFIRWLQANTFMPSIQFSYVPWDYNDESIDTLELSRKFVELHALYSGEIIKAMERAISEGYPVNAPIWWVDPTNPNALQDYTQFLLGEDIVVAPVLDEGAVSRDVYLPSGTWIDGNTGEVLEGNQTLEDYNAPIEILPYFVREGSDAALIHLKSKVSKSSR